MNFYPANSRIIGKNKDYLDELAYELATNHCTVSFGEAEKQNVSPKDIFELDTSKNSIAKSIIEKTVTSRDATIKDIVQHRNIMVIGAGATYDSYKCIPLGEQVKQRFKEEYMGKINEFPAIKERYDKYLKDLKAKGGELDFENYLALFAELIMTPDELRKEISDMYDFRYVPSLPYEIIAHLFKHSFIDVIINFNFDEILDRAIEEELGKDNYFRIVSDGDCVSINDITFDGRLKIPLYIKPHGTVSFKNSLRFTKNHYLDLPDKIEFLLKELISGKRGEVDAVPIVPNIEQVNLISVGFNMASIEFTSILDECLPAKSKIFHFTYSREDEKRDKPFFVQNILKSFWGRAHDAYHINKENETELATKGFDPESFHNKIYKRIAIEEIEKPDKNTLTTPLGEMFSYLWRQAYHCFRKDLLPRSIGSHEISMYLFYDNNFSKESKEPYGRDSLRENYENSIAYYLDKTIVEIAIAINRNNGIIELAQILGDRVGFYYTQYRRRYVEQNKSERGIKTIYCLVKEFVGTQTSDKEYYFSNNIFRIEIKEFSYETEAETKKALHRWHLADTWDANTDFSGEKYKSFIDDLKFNVLINAISGNLIKASNKYFERYGKVANTVLYYLFTSRLLSENFVKRFKRNYNKTVFNYRPYKDGEEPLFLDNKETNDDGFVKDSVVMIVELFRIFHKSANGHYYTIKPSYKDPKNLLVRSFSPKRILHTNLALEYKFREMFRSKKWDVALIVSENGGLLNFKDDTKPETKDNGERGTSPTRTLIVINSFEAIRQLDDNYDESEPIQTLNDSTNAIHKKNIDDPGIITHTYCIPAAMHNNHMMLFLEKEQDERKESERRKPWYEFNDNDKKNVVEMRGGLYTYRRGFSNSINPVFIGANPYFPANNSDNLNGDFMKLLGIFALYLKRSIEFGGEGLFQLTLGEKNSMQWAAKDERDAIDALLKHLYLPSKAQKK